MKDRPTVFEMQQFRKKRAETLTEGTRELSLNIYKRLEKTLPFDHPELITFRRKLRQAGIDVIRNGIIINP